MDRQLQLTLAAALFVLGGFISAGARSSMPAQDRWNPQHVEGLPWRFVTLSPPSRAYVVGRWRLNTRSRDISKTEP